MMHKLGFAPEFGRLLLSYYDMRNTKYLWNIFYSKDYDTNNGVPQGDPLSPIISVLYLSLIIKALFPSPCKGVSCLSFIDDFVLVVNNPLLCDNVSQLEAAFTQLNQVMALVGLHFFFFFK